MGKCKNILLITLLFTMSGCTIVPSISNNISSINTSSSNVSSTSSSTSSSYTSSISSSTIVTDSSTNNSTNSSITSATPNTLTLDIYASNDIHGRVSENSGYNEPGIAKLTSYLQEKKASNPEGYIYLNSGDYWQDTYESGYNKGKLLTECLDIMECEAIALGNHEFDWGIDVIKENKKLVNYTKFLGANIRKYPNTNEQVDFAEPYKIIERNGIKVGIIGAIGQDQITSITSSNWENITFLPHADVIKTVSDELRVEKGCDVVLLSIHADESDSKGSEITKVSPVSNKKYVDAVFCAHSHQREVKYYNEVPFVQAGDHGRNLSYVQLQYNDGNITVNTANYVGYGLMSKCEPNKDIQNIIDKYFTSEFNTKKNKVHGTISGASSIDSDTAGRILAKATYDVLQEKNIDCDIVINNGARDTVSSGTMTSEMIFNMIPFTNKTLVATQIKGQDILNETVKYPNPYYMPDSSLKIESNEYYTVACIDYMMLHKNTYRNYNYFTSYKTSNLIYTIEDYPNIIVENYLQKHGSISTYDYSESNYTCLG